MKRIIYIVSLLLFAATCFAQPIVNRSNSSITVQDARWGAQYNLLVPRYDDTTAANVQKGIDTCGAIIFTYSGNTLWVRSCADGKKWVAVGSGGAGSGTVTEVTWTGGIVSIANPTTTPAFTIAGTNGGIPYFNSASTWATSAALAANSLVIGGGAGAAPSSTTTGTGVLTALGINVGSAGAFVTFNGALGTPSSGTATNLTGLPVSTGISGLGTGVATALAVNVGSAGAFVTFNGAGGTPSSITLTNATGTAASLNIGGTAPAGSLTGTTLNATVVTTSITSTGTMTSGTLSTGYVIGGVTMTLGSDASFDMYYRNGSGVLTRLANGTDDQVLTAHTGAAPTWEAAAGGSSLFPVTGTGTATGNVIGDLDGNTLSVQQGGNSFLSIDPTAGAEQSTLAAYNTTDDDNTSGVVGVTSNSDAQVYLIAEFNGAAKSASIAGVANTTDATLAYTADTHTFTGTVLFDDGGTAAGTAFIYYQAGSVLSVPVTGALEFDGKVQYFTTESGRGIVPSVSWAMVAADHPLSDVNTAQTALPAAYDVFTLQGGTTYYFEGQFNVACGTTSHAFGMGFAQGGTGTLDTIRYNTLGWAAVDNNTQSVQATGRYVNVTPNTLQMAASTVAGNNVKFWGIIVVAAGDPITLTPQIQFGAAPGGTNIMKRGSYIRFEPLGSNTFTHVGNVN